MLLRRTNVVVVLALLAVFGSEEGQRAGETLIEDEARFIDFERSSLFLTEEHTILDA